jgi:hypothetical protein
MSLKAILVTKAHLAEGQFVLAEQTFNIEKFLTGTGRLKISGTEGHVRINANLNEEQSTEVILPVM